MCAMREGVARVGAGIAAGGLVVLVTGTFLPWLRSGTVLRDSFQAVGAVRELLDVGVAGVLLAGWPAVVPACAVCVALYALRLRRTSGVVCGILALAVGTAAGLASVQPGDAGSLVGVATTGPIVTLAGATLALAGAITVVMGPHGGQARTREGSP
jgi:hypothetical protein